MDEQTDPSAIRSIAVTAGDVVTAIERSLRSKDDVVLRVTPPFAGRMRARIHRAGDDQYGEPAPIHVDPTDLVDDVPAYPEPAETEDDLRSDPDREYAPDRHREYHQQVVEEWRARIGERIVEETTLQWDGGSHRVTVKRLG
ncbi:hypothetical protein ACFQH2_06755 [Natronoarchaeum sp. GCM10025703]|uniref:hypothetical protein n=1 Tax=unclassified Natronoarchaeum TaxID=2620183 RepID=UPI00361EF164